MALLQADTDGADNAVTFCKECGNNVHVECFKRWTASKKSSGEPVTCVYCRHPWLDTGTLGFCCMASTSLFSVFTFGAALQYLLSCHVLHNASTLLHGLALLHGIICRLCLVMFVTMLD